MMETSCISTHTHTGVIVFIQAVLPEELDKVEFRRLGLGPCRMLRCAVLLTFGGPCQAEHQSALQDVRLRLPICQAYYDILPVKLVGSRTCRHGELGEKNEQASNKTNSSKLET